MRRLGDSVDWERERFTMDEASPPPSRGSVRAPVRNDGLMYRGKRLVNWDPVQPPSRPGSGKPREDQGPHGTFATAGQRRQTAEGQDHA